MTVATRLPAPHAYTVAPPAPFTPVVRPMRDDELPWAIHSWSQAWKDSPHHRGRTWTDYKAFHLQPIRDALCREDTRRIAVDGPIPGRAVGWMAWSRWPSIDVVHWVYVSKQFRRALSRKLAPAGAMTAMLDHAGLRSSVVHTFLAAVQPGLPKGQRGEPGRNDHWIAERLRERGHTVSYVPFKEWSR